MVQTYCPGFSWDRVNFHQQLAGLTQPFKWDILHHVMSCSAFQCEAGWRRGFCYSGASWALGGENFACCICFLSVLLLFSSFAILLNCSHPNPQVFCLFPSDSPPRPFGEGEGVREELCGSLLQIEAKPQHMLHYFRVPQVWVGIQSSFLTSV